MRMNTSLFPMVFLTVMLLFSSTAGIAQMQQDEDRSVTAVFRRKLQEMGDAWNEFVLQLKNDFHQYKARRIAGEETSGFSFLKKKIDEAGQRIKEYLAGLKDRMMKLKTKQEEVTQETQEIRENLREQSKRPRRQNESLRLQAGDVRESAEEMRERKRRESNSTRLQTSDVRKSAEAMRGQNRRESIDF